MKKSHDGRLAAILVVALLVIDQVIKILVKTNMRLHESIEVTSWFYIDFVENVERSTVSFYNRQSITCISTSSQHIAIRSSE